MLHMKLTTLFVNLKRFNALLPSVIILLVVVVLGWTILSQKSWNTTKTVAPLCEVVGGTSLILQLRLLDFDVGANQVVMNSGTKFFVIAFELTHPNQSATILRWVHLKGER